NMYSAGDFFGYTEIFKDSKYLKNAQIIESSELILLPKKKFLQLVYNDSLIARQFMTLLSHSLYEKEENLLNMAYSPLRKKVAKGITKVIDKFKDVQKDGKPVIEISRQDLAHVVGSSPESMIRTLKQFKTEKLIDVLNKTIIVLNENKLRNLK
ncbi:MAG: Crp/Fnr family transcriptional regulator, partial [Daejeonella sp.]